MSALHLRPEIHIPWQAIAAFAAAAYVVRSAVRGWDFRPDLLDVFVFGALALIIVARVLVVRFMRDEDEDRPRT